MITFKQIDALYWIAELGSFEAAANKLNMSQSAISKRIQELEETFDVEIFDRSKRNARLTEKGAELLDYAKDLLEPISKSRSTSSVKPRPASTHLESNIDYLREKEGLSRPLSQAQQAYGRSPS